MSGKEELESAFVENSEGVSKFKALPRGQFWRKSVPKLIQFSLCWAEGEVEMYRIYREI